MANSTNAAAQPALSVSQLTARIKDLLEGQFPSVWVAGEVSNFSRPQSGHWYFTLKDDQAQIRAVMWRGTAARVKFDLADGLEVVCHGHVDVYAPRGSYQLVVDELQPKGVGALELALRKLRDKLAAEGLFDPARKRPLPAFPRRLAFVTSPTGAAVRDFLGSAAPAVARRRRAGHPRARAGRRRGAGDRRRHPRREPVCVPRPTCWSSAAAAAASKTCGRSTRSRSCGRLPRRACRPSRRWATRST